MKDNDKGGCADARPLLRDTDIEDESREAGR